MFSNAEIKEFVTKLGKHWFFPDFNNKLTWWVVGTGVGVVLFSPPVWMEIFNWCLEQLNTNTGANLVLTKLGEGPGAGFGVSLIGIGLLHNVAVKGINTWADAIAYKKKVDAYRQDKRLMDEFILSLPSDSPAVIFLRDQDFGNSFFYENITVLEGFLHKWKGAERRFVSPDLEAARLKFCSAVQEFMIQLSSVCGPVGQSDKWFTVIPTSVTDEFNCPSYVLKSIEDLNKKSSEAFALHQELISLGRGVAVASA